MATDNKHCSHCKKPLVFRLIAREGSQYSDPEAEHKKDTGAEDRLLNVRWLSATSIRDRKKELAARCPYQKAS